MSLCLKSARAWPLCICYAVHIQTGKCVALLSPCLPVTNPRVILQKKKGVIKKRHLVNKYKATEIKTHETYNTGIEI